MCYQNMFHLDRRKNMGKYCLLCHQRKRKLCMNMSEFVLYKKSNMAYQVFTMQLNQGSATTYELLIKMGILVS